MSPKIFSANLYLRAAFQKFALIRMGPYATTQTAKLVLTTISIVLKHVVTVIPELLKKK